MIGKMNCISLRWCRRGTSAVRGSGLSWIIPLLALTLHASGQPTIPSDLKNRGTLSPSHEQSIDEYIDYWYLRISTATDKEVRQAREKLTEPLRGAAAVVFRQTYSTKLTARMRDALKAESVLVRINAMMAVRDLFDDGAVALIQSGLADQSPGVRFHAGRAVIRLAGSKRLDESDQIEILTSVAAACKKEAYQPVLEEFLNALASLTIHKAGIEFLHVINDRVNRLAVEGEPSIRTEREGLTQLFQKMVLEPARVKRGDSARLMVVVAFRYMCFSARHVVPINMPGAQEEDYRKMVLLCGNILHWLAPKIKEGVTTPAKVEENTTKQDLLLRCAEWQTLLGKQLDFKANELEIRRHDKPGQSGPMDQRGDDMADRAAAATP